MCSTVWTLLLKYLKIRGPLLQYVTKTYMQLKISNGVNCEVSQKGKCKNKIFGVLVLELYNFVLCVRVYVSFSLSFLGLPPLVINSNSQAQKDHKQASFACKIFIICESLK